MPNREYPLCHDAVNTGEMLCHVTKSDHQVTKSNQG